MQKGFYNRVMTSNRVLNSSKNQPVIQSAKINNGEILKFVHNDVDKKVVSNEVKEAQVFSSVLLENRVNNLENIIQALLSKNIEIESKLNELQRVTSHNEENVEIVKNEEEEEDEVVHETKKVHFELKEFDTIVEEN
jgi:hypothetical protein